MAPYEIATRAQVLALKCIGTPTHEIALQTGISPRAINRILDRAITRGFDPTNKPFIILNRHVEDAPHPGRSIRQTYKPRNPSSTGSTVESSQPQHSPLDGRSLRPEEQLGIDTTEENQSQGWHESSDDSFDTLSPTLASPSPTLAPTRCLQAQKLMLPIFGESIELSKLVFVIQAGDSFIRHEAMDFLQTQLPLWDGIWCQTNLPNPTRDDSIMIKFVKIFQCITLLDRRSQLDDLRLRFHRVLQYQLYIKFKEEVAREKKNPSQRNATLAIERLLKYLYPGWTNVDEWEREKRKRDLQSRKKPGKRLQILCNYFGYGILLLGSQKTVNRMKVPIATFLSVA
jgi:hypothetical protein